jgi:hypothetical protein
LLDRSRTPQPVSPKTQATIKTRSKAVFFMETPFVEFCPLIT